MRKRRTAPAEIAQGVVEWRAPADTSQARGKWAKRLSPLTARPGEWAMIWTCSTTKQAHQTASNLRSGYVVLPPGRWEFQAVAGEANQGKHEVFARYLGTADDI